jgi:hypothetical protein
VEEYLGEEMDGLSGEETSGGDPEAASRQQAAGDATLAEEEVNPHDHHL